MDSCTLVAAPTHFQVDSGPIPLLFASSRQRMSVNDSAVGLLPMKGALGIVVLEFAFLLTARADGPIYRTPFSQASFHQQVATPHPTKGITAGESLTNRHSFNIIDTRHREARISYTQLGYTRAACTCERCEFCILVILEARWSRRSERESLNLSGRGSKLTNTPTHFTHTPTSSTPL